MKKKFRVAFLDRDGVINKTNLQNRYIGYKKNFKLIPGAIASIKYLKSLNYKVVIVTNQSGIARGYFTHNDVNKLHKYLQYILKKKNTNLDKIVICPYHKDGIIKKYKKNSILRKPKIGMFTQAKNDLNIDIEKSWVVGDSNRDILAAKNAGMKSVLIHSETESIDKENSYKVTPDYIAEDLNKAVKLILKEIGK